MGLFSKKKKVTVGVTAVRMADKVQSPYTQGVLTSVLANKKITEIFKAEALKGFYSKTEAFYRFGKNHYVNGLPEGFKTYTDINLSQITTVLNKIFSIPVTVNSAKISFGDYVYFGYVDLQVHFLYNPATKLIGKPPITYPAGTKVKVLSINMQEGSYTLNVEIEKLPLVAGDPPPAKEYTSYGRIYSFDNNKTYLHVKYQFPSDIEENSYRYWYYDVLSETYPEINKILNDAYISPFYPLVPVRQNAINVIDTANKDNITKMLNKLGISLESVTDSIMNTSDGNDPSKIDECFIGLFANLDTTCNATKRYLWEFFEEQRSKQKITKNIYDTWYSNKTNRDTPQEALTIQEKDFNIRLLWNYIDESTKAGVLGKVGTTTLSRTLAPRYILNGFDFEESKLVIAKQITPTTYTEITVHGLEHIVDVYEGSLYSTTLADLDDTDRKYGFFIPLDRNIIKRVPYIERSELMQDCLTLVVYAVQITYVKWYQRGFFKFLITIAMVVIAIYTGQYEMLFTEGLTWATAVAIATSIVVNIIIMEGLQLIVGMIGGELAAILAVAVAIYSFTSPNPSIFGISDPKLLLQASTMTIEASNRVIAEDFSKLMEDFNDLTKSITEKQKEIEEAYLLLGSKDIDFFDLRKGGFYFNPRETPEDFFQRTVHNKNPGAMSYELISSFYENALKLEVPYNGS